MEASKRTLEGAWKQQRTKAKAQASFRAAKLLAHRMSLCSELTRTVFVLGRFLQGLVGHKSGAPPSRSSWFQRTLVSGAGGAMVRGAW